MTRAGFGPRAAAYIIDRALLLIPLGILRLASGVGSLFGGGQFMTGYFLFNHSFLDVVCWLVVSVYFVLLTWFGGATLGKMVMRLRVVREDGAPMRFIDVLYRETIGRFLSGILCFGYLMVLGDRGKRGFHDWLCGTCVVYDVTTRAKPEDPAEPVDFGWAQPTETPSGDGMAQSADASADYGWSLPGSPRPEDFRTDNGDDL